MRLENVQEGTYGKGTCFALLASVIRESGKKGLAHKAGNHLDELYTLARQLEKVDDMKMRLFMWRLYYNHKKEKIQPANGHTKFDTVLRCCMKAVYQNTLRKWGIKYRG